jgi:hypothetical protein
VRTVAAYGLSQDMVSLYTRAQEGPREKLRKRAMVDGAAFGFGQGMFVFLCARPHPSFSRSLPPFPGHLALTYARILTAHLPPAQSLCRRARVLVRRLPG